jgi:hypothetical protein
MNIFQQILDCRSLTLIGYLAEDAIPLATSDSERKALQAIIETNKLDEAWALSHEQLGQHDKAAELRQFLASRATRQMLSPECEAS